MFSLGLNYTKLVKKDGKQYLTDPDFVEGRRIQAERLAQSYGAIKRMLERYDYPCSQGWILAVAESGSDGFDRMLAAENDSQADRLGVPRYIVEQWRKSTRQAVPPELWNEADVLKRQIADARDGLPINPGDIYFNPETKEIEVNVEAIVSRVESVALMEVSDAVKAEAESIREIAKRMREMNEAGLNVIEVVLKWVGNFLAPSRYPNLDNDLELFKDIVSCRHQSREAIKISSPEYYYLHQGE